ncbi:MAG: DUF4292 domain-containing protein [Hymenobacter sp.]
MKATNTNFDYLSGRGKVHFKTKDAEQSANFALRVRRDSAIWLSGSLLGFEGVRALLTPDSVRVVNRLKKEYFAGDYAYLSQLLKVPVTYRQMQDILLGDYQEAPKGALPVLKKEGENSVGYLPRGRPHPRAAGKQRRRPPPAAKSERNRRPAQPHRGLFRLPEAHRHGAALRLHHHRAGPAGGGSQHLGHPQLPESRSRLRAFGLPVQRAERV